MDQTAKLLDTLKAYLKSRDITYRNLAQRLKLSESVSNAFFRKKRFLSNAWKEFFIPSTSIFTISHT